MKRGIYLAKTNTRGTKPQALPEKLTARCVFSDRTQYGYISNPDNLSMFEAMGWEKVTKKEVANNRGCQLEMVAAHYSLIDYLTRFPMD